MAFPGGTLDEAYKRFKLPLIPFSCVTTSDGNAAGTTIISTQLIGIAAVVMNSCAIIITAGDYLGFKAPVMAFDTATGGLTLGDAMGVAIVAGTRFAIVPAEAVSVDIALDDTLVFVGVCSAGMTGSTTTIVCPDMVGKWANDFFNTDWLAIVLLDVDDPGDAPEGERRDITDYVSATGTFTTQAFSGNVEAGDVIMFVRKEIVAGTIAQGMFYLGQCNAGMTGSTGTIVSGDLGGFPDDFFNTDYVMVVILDVDDIGDAPEGEVRDITNYVGATGTFTTVAFTANVEELDWILVARREFFLVDGVALKATPIVNSFAYRVAQYLAGGDGDFATATPLPADASLYDTLGTPQHFTASASSTTTLTADALVNVAGAYVGAIAVPLSGNMAGQGRYITAYNGTTQITVLPAWSADPGSVDFIIIPSNLGRILLALGVEYTTGLDLYDTIVTGYTTAVTAVVQGSVLERLELLQDVSITGNAIYTATATTTTAVTCAALPDGASYFIGQMLVPITDIMAGQGRYITAYDGTGVLTVDPPWAADPSDTMVFVIVPSETSRLLLALGAEYAGVTDLYDTIVTGYTTAVTAVPVGAVLERLQLLQQAGIVKNTIWTATASAVTTLTDATLLDVAGAYVGQIAIPLAGNMEGHGRYITAYDGTQTITVTPPWAADPGLVDFIIVPSDLSIVYEAIAGAAGILAWPGAAVPAANVSLAEVVSYIYSEQFGTEFDGSPDLYDVMVTGYTSAVAAVVQGAVLERLELLQDVGITGNAVYIATASAVGSLTCAGLPDGASYFIGQMVVPITGVMAGQGRYITAYDGAGILSVAPDWPADPSSPSFVMVPSEMSRLLLALGSEFDGSPDVYDAIVTGWTGAATRTPVGSLIERVQLLQEAGIMANTVWTATASGVASLTDASLIDVAGAYVGQIAIPLAGDMTGHGRHITAYDGTGVLTVSPAWAADPGTVAFIIIPSDLTRVLEVIGSEFDGSPDVYDVMVTGYTTAVTATAVGSILERLQLLQQALLNNNTIFTSSAATVNTVTSAALVDRADLYEGMMLVPMTGDQAGQGRYITAYDDTGVLTVVPDWGTDPDAAGAFTFVIMPTPAKFLYEAGKGLSAIYDIVNGVPVLSRVYSDYNILVLTVEETVFEYDDAAAVWHPEWLVFHLDELAGGEQIEVKIYEKDNDIDNNERPMIHLTYNNAQAVPVKFVELPPVDLYFKVTVEQTGGVLRDVIFKLYRRV